MSVINTNITALIGQQNLGRSQSSLQTSMERLSSGLRINSAKDDAAGQAIANRMSSQITGLQQAQRNANDGISAAQTAEGALNQVNDNLQRIRELTVQAQNSTNSDGDLESIQNEIGQRLNEINRISEETSFNGVKVLAEDNTLSIQVGANDGEAIKIDMNQINAETLGLNGFNVDGTGTPNSTAKTQDLSANGFNQVGSTGEYKNDTFNQEATAADLFENLQDGAEITQDTGVVYTYDASSDTFSFGQEDASLDDFDADLGLTPSAGGTNAITVNLGGTETRVNVSSSGALSNAETGENLYLTGETGTMDLSETSAGGSQATIEDLVAEIGESTGTASITTEEGVVYKTSTTAGSTGAIDTENETIEAEALLNQINNDTGNDYDFDLDGAASTATEVQFSVDTSGAVTDDGGATTYVSGFEGDFTLTSEQTASVYLNDNDKITDGAANEIYVSEKGDLTLDAVSGASATEDPLGVLDEALNSVDELRSDLGAIQNRLESAVDNLSTTSTNLSAARSRIEDADYAVEVSNMTRAQILQQAGTSVLAQANQVPQSVLSLLG